MDTSAAGGTPVQHTMNPTPQLLVEVARREILERGYQGASLRNIARRANVDPNLVRHYFGSKQNLLMHATRAGIDPEALAAEVLRGTPKGVARRLVKVMLALWDNPDTSLNSLVVLAASLNSTEVATFADEAFVRQFFGTIARAVSPDHHELRASLVASQMLSLAFSRHLIGDPVLAAASQQDLVRIIGRTVDRYLTEPLSLDATGRQGGTDVPTAVSA